MTEQLYEARIQHALSASNDYLAESGLTILVDRPLAEKLVPSFAKVKEMIESEAREMQVPLFSSTNANDWDSCVEGSFEDSLFTTLYGPAEMAAEEVEQRVPYVTLSITPIFITPPSAELKELVSQLGVSARESDEDYDPDFADSTITQRQRVFLDEIIRNQVVLCLDALSIDRNDVRPDLA